MNPPSFSLPSFAKINWSLQVLGKRLDGYHEVRTVLQTISLHDDVQFELANGKEVSLFCDDPNVPTDKENLIIRAAHSLQKRFNVDQGVRVQLRKKIPIKAGLGGASSNAAVALLALKHLWRIQAAKPELLLEIAAGLGADVPFFLLGGAALATGTGTTVTPTMQADDGEVRYLIVLSPSVSVATTEAYKALDDRSLTSINGDPILSSSRHEAEFRHSQPWDLSDDWKNSLLGGLKNDFEPVIFDIEPEIRRTKETLLQAGASGALLAGSGSSVFGIFKDQKAQQRAINEIKLEAGWRIFPCVTVSRKEYVSAVGSWDIPFLRSFKSGSDIGA